MIPSKFGPLDLIVGGLAVYRTSRMFVEELGPGDVFDRIRRLANRWEFTGELFACIYCLSVWVGGFFAVLFALWPNIARGLTRALAFSMIAVWIKEGSDNG